MKSINYEVLRMQQAAESAFDFDCKRCGSDDIKILTGKNKGKAQCENCLNIWTWQSVKLDSEPARTVPSDENAFKKMEKKSTKNETANWTDKLAGLKAKYLGEGSSETTREHVDKPVSKERSKYLEKTTDPIYDDFTSNAAKSAPKEGSKPTKEPVDLSDDDFAWPTQKLKRKKRPASPKLDDDTSGSEFVPDTNDDVPGDNSEDDEDLDYVRQPATKKARRRSAKRRADTMTIKSEEKESDDDDDVDMVGAPFSKTRKRNPVTVRGKIEAKNEQKELRALHRLVICKSTPVPDEKSVEEIIETDSDEAEQERVYEFNPLNVFSDEENDTALDKKRKRSRVAPAVDFDEQPKNPKAHFVPRPANKFNAFFLYNAEQRKVISENNPDLAPARISKLIAENWKNLPEEEKAKYKERSQKQKQEWLEAQGLNRQRLPPNGYVLFSNSIFREIKSEHPEYEMKEISAIIGARWKKLDPEKKKEFNDKSKELRAKFKEENPQTYEEWIKRRNEASKVTKNKNKYL